MAVTSIGPNSGILNDYSIRPKNLTQYTAFRGVTDFTQIGQFNQFEKGYSFLSVLEMPKFMTKLASIDNRYADMVNSFQHMLEYEFRGMDGLQDIQAQTLELTDGINSMNMINRVNMETNITVSSSYFERSGSLITKFSESYLTGIKDRISQAKTYHGLIKHGYMEPGYENEVFTMLYYVTDNTMLRLERAILLCNMQLTKAEISMYNGSRQDIGSNNEMTVEWTAFPVMGYEVDKAAKVLLEDITGVAVDATDSVGNVRYQVVKTDGVAALDSTDYKYAIMDDQSPDAIKALTQAIDRA